MQAKTLKSSHNLVHEDLILFWSLQFQIFLATLSMAELVLVEWLSLPQSKNGEFGKTGNSSMHLFFIVIREISNL